MARNFLKDLRRGMTVQDVFLVETANFKQARNGSNFIQMVLRDCTGSVRALRWESNEGEFRRLEQNPFVLTSGRVEEFQGKLQIVVDELTPLSADDAQVDPSEFLPRTRHSIEKMLEELHAIVADIPDTGIRALVQGVLRRPAVERGLPLAPAGKAMHHAYVGGLLEHVLSLTKLALRVLDHYPWLDRSLFLAGVVLHDLGKIEELGYHTGFNYTDEGQLIGHIVMVTTWIDETARELPDLDTERLLELKHIVLSHHGKLEFGSPKTPMTAEAIALHFIDNLDAKLAGFLDAFHDTRPRADGNRWGDYSVMHGNRLYFGRRLDEAVPPALDTPTPGGPPAAKGGGDRGGARGEGSRAPRRGGGDGSTADLPF